MPKDKPMPAGEWLETVGSPPRGFDQPYHESIAHLEWLQRHAFESAAPSPMGAPYKGYCALCGVPGTYVPEP